MQWSFSASWLVCLLALALWAGSGWLCWQNWRRRGGRMAGGLEALRFLVITLIGLTLLRPEVVHRTLLEEEPEIVILADASGSMETRDVVLTPGQVVERREWLDQLIATNFWSPLEAGATVRLTEFDRPTATNEPSIEIGTDLNAALEDALQQHRNLKAVLLLSDGDWNLGESPVSAATRYRSRRIPVYTVSVGSEQPLPDITLVSVSPPSYGLQGEQISIPFRVRSHLDREVRTTVTLRNGNQVETTRDIVLPAHGSLQDSLVWSPRRVGEYTLNLQIPVEADEYLKDNNEQRFPISIRVETLKVLVVESLPRWEYRYLRNALSRDPGVDLDCLLFHPAMGPGDGPDYITAFPADRQELSEYDVIFLGDVGIGSDELSLDQAEMIRGLVGQQGSGLVFLPGPRGRQLTFQDTPLRDLLPVTFDDGDPEGLTTANESSLQLTGNGREHFLTRLAGDASRNDFVWRQLPGFYWGAAVERSRPGADVLAVHSSLRNEWGRLPLLATRPFGSGEVLFMGTDSAWRWRRGVEDKYHYRFWSQVVRWMSHKRHLARGDGIRLSYSPETPRAGETVFLQAITSNLGDFGRERAPLAATLRSPEGTIERISLSPLPGGWGVYQSSFVPRQGGPYEITVRDAGDGAELTTELTVTRPVREKQGQPANQAILREIAGLTGGAHADAGKIETLLGEISALPEPEPAEFRTRLWSNPWWGGLILGLLAIYWTGRKVAGML